MLLCAWQSARPSRRFCRKRREHRGTVCDDDLDRRLFVRLLDWWSGRILGVGCGCGCGGGGAGRIGCVRGRICCASRGCLGSHMRLRFERSGLRLLGRRGCDRGDGFWRVGRMTWMVSVIPYTGNKAIAGSSTYCIILTSLPHWKKHW